MDHNDWQPDFLGPEFATLTVPLPDDDEGEVVTTVIRLRPDNEAPRFAVLAIHGWNDYFYQRELARSAVAAGGAFYALDLRKYGRSLRPWQTFGYIEDLTDYDDDIHAALDVIHSECGLHIPVVLYGHSTGGLTASLWADRHPGAVAGLVLNSPWLELQGATGTRQVGAPVVDLVRKAAPKAVIPTGGNDFYQRALTAWKDDGVDVVPGHEGSSDPFWTTGWEPRSDFRRAIGAPVRSTWLAAILEGHATVAEGLDISCPILTLTSARSITGDEWSEDFRAADSVLDVRNIWKRLPFLGPHVTLVKLDGAIHDVTFSRREVRERAFSEISRFVTAYVI